MQYMFNLLLKIVIKTIYLFNKTIYVLFIFINLFFGKLFSQKSDFVDIKFDFIIPFTINMDPMEKLLLINFEKDPDEIYIGFEPQYFNDNKNGNGFLIIGWRKDGKIDVYHQNSLIIDRSKYNIAGSGLNIAKEVYMENPLFNISDFGINAHFKFVDLYHRTIEIIINENNPKKTKPFGLLAPMGDAATNPKSLPLLFLHDFYFVRKKNSEITLSINDRIHKVDLLPLLMDGQKMTFIRYCSRPLILTINDENNSTPLIINLKNKVEFLDKDNCRYIFDWQNNTPNLKKIIFDNKIHPITINFNPFIPDISNLKNIHLIEGKFKITGHESVGSIEGEYQIKYANDSIFMQIIPVGGWTPKPTNLATKFLFTAAKVFKKWPSTYKWNAVAYLDQSSQYSIKSQWIRTGKTTK